MAVAVTNSKSIFLSHRQNPFSKTLLQEFSEPCSCEFSLPAYVQKGATPGYAQVIAEWYFYLPKSAHLNHVLCLHSRLVSQTQPGKI